MVKTEDLLVQIKEIECLTKYIKNIIMMTDEEVDEYIKSSEKEWQIKKT